MSTFEIGGAIRTMQREPDQDASQQCSCCRPRGHVFSVGIELSPAATGTLGRAATSPSDWIFQVLYAHRFENGRKVRLTLELLDEHEQP